jgi:DeoR/GlpR family transcriptional regulator of sugar metabolism
MSLKDDRKQEIQRILRDDRQVTVSRLSERFGVSEVTIRRDLGELETDGLLRRFHGGAVAVDRMPPEPPVIQRMEESSGYKEAIGAAAAALVADGDAIFLGSGSTVAYVAQHLLDRNDVTVITNALTVADTLAMAEGVTMVMTGGVLRPSEMSLIGHIAESALEDLRVDKVIIGMRAISINAGMTHDYLPEVVTDRAIIEMSDHLVVVADHTKFDRMAPAFVAPVSRITSLVTDADADPDVITQFRALGVRVILAPQKEYR